MDSHRSRNRTLALLGTVSLLLGSITAAAATSATTVTSSTTPGDRLRAGLWEVSTTSPLLQLTRQIPPEQMTQLRQLASRYGVGMPDISGDTATGKVCVSASMAHRNILPGLEQARAGCRSHDARRTGSHYEVELTCKSAEIDGSGSAQGDVVTPESFTGSSQFQGTVKGFPVDEHAQTSGRWISADCGSVRPLQ